MERAGYSPDSLEYAFLKADTLGQVIVNATARRFPEDQARFALDCQQLGFERGILREIVSPSRVAMRDAKSYCAVLLDDNNRKPICRLYFNGGKRYVTVFDTEGGERADIGDLGDLYALATRLKAAVARHEPSAS